MADEGIARVDVGLPIGKTTVINAPERSCGTLELDFGVSHILCVRVDSFTVGPIRETTTGKLMSGLASIVAMPFYSPFREWVSGDRTCASIHTESRL
jgi:hypothetical protein